MALDVLSMMGPGKRIVVTPGMIELGDRQEELNREFGKKVATCADIAIVVGEYNRAAITEGIESVADRTAEVRREPVGLELNASSMMVTPPGVRFMFRRCSTCSIWLTA